MSLTASAHSLHALDPEGEFLAAADRGEQR